MASYVDRPDLWRLHSLNGIVPLKYEGVDGEFQPEQGEIQFKCTLQAGDIKQFLVETFPPPIRVGNIFVPQSSGLPGLPSLTATKVSFKNKDDGLPIDPFVFDPAAPSGTYGKLIEVTVSYGMNKLQKPDPTNPFSFLEISGNHTGDFISTTAPSGSYLPVKSADATAAKIKDKTVPGAQNAPADAPPLSPRIPVANPTVKVVITAPQCEWTVKWNQIPFEYFRDVLVYRLRWAQGRVNSDIMPVLFNLEPETCLFLGWDYQQQYTWRDGEIDTPPVNVTMKFLEKRLIWNGYVIGHNHVWRPEAGWTYFTIDGTNPLHDLRDLNGLFQA